MYTLDEAIKELREWDDTHECGLVGSDPEGPIVPVLAELKRLTSVERAVADLIEMLPISRLTQPQRDAMQDVAELLNSKEES